MGNYPLIPAWDTIGLYKPETSKASGWATSQIPVKGHALCAILSTRKKELEVSLKTQSTVECFPK